MDLGSKVLGQGVEGLGGNSVVKLPSSNSCFRADTVKTSLVSQSFAFCTIAFWRLVSSRYALRSCSDETAPVERLRVHDATPCHDRGALR